MDTATSLMQVGFGSKVSDIPVPQEIDLKRTVFTAPDPNRPGIHHFQVLDTNGKPVEGPPLR